MTKITVYPTSKNATVLRHPIDGRLLPGGSLWTRDGYTARCLVDDAITVDPAKGWQTRKVDVDLSIPPAHATAVPDNPFENRVTVRGDSKQKN